MFFYFKNEQFLFMPIIVSTKCYFCYLKHNKLIYVIFSHFIYNINSNHNFNQTYHDMLLDKKKSNHKFNQTHILYKPTTTKMIFSKSLLSNHNYNNYHQDKHILINHMTSLTCLMQMCLRLWQQFEVLFAQKCIKINFFIFQKLFLTSAH